MSVVCQYGILLDENRIPKLVKEDEVLYGERDCFSSPSSLASLLSFVFHTGFIAEEHVYLIALDDACQVKGMFDVSCGTSNAAHMNYRGLFTRALLCGATGIVIAHNHTSGVLKPSCEDIASTKKLVQAGEIMDIKVLDHLIVCGDNYVSLHEAGYL